MSFIELVSILVREVPLGLESVLVVVGQDIFYSKQGKV